VNLDIKNSSFEHIIFMALGSRYHHPGLIRSVPISFNGAQLRSCSDNQRDPVMIISAYQLRAEVSPHALALVRCFESTDRGAF
jgi:hypothetical protein